MADDNRCRGCGGGMSNDYLNRQCIFHRPGCQQPLIDAENEAASLRGALAVVEEERDRLRQAHGTLRTAVEVAHGNLEQMLPPGASMRFFPAAVGTLAFGLEQSRRELAKGSRRRA